LHIHSIDRLGRNTIMVLSVWKELTDLGIRVVCRIPNIQNFDENLKQDPFSTLLLEICVSMSSFEKSMTDMRRKEGIERTKKLEPWKYSGRKIGSTLSPLKFLQKEKSKMIIKDLSKGYSITDISNLRRCSFSTIYKVKKLMIEHDFVV
ncbi:recombinase family protein, partial [Aureispira]|nr:recombinase family protein [Aureispira sp.]